LILPGDWGKTDRLLDIVLVVVTAEVERTAVRTAIGWCDHRIVSKNARPFKRICTSAHPDDASDHHAAAITRVGIATGSVALLVDWT
jgi:hypothetical protein